MFELQFAGVLKRRQKNIMTKEELSKTLTYIRDNNELNHMEKSIESMKICCQMNEINIEDYDSLILFIDRLHLSLIEKFGFAITSLIFSDATNKYLDVLEEFPKHLEGED